MARFHAWLLGMLLLSILAVESRRLYFQQCWASDRSTVVVAAAKRAPWSVLVVGSSLAYSGIVPDAFEQGLALAGLRDETVFDLGIYGAVPLAELAAYREVRVGHRPRAAILALAPRDMDASVLRDAETRPSVEATASLAEIVAFSARAPRRRFELPWRAACRDLGVPLQALAAWSPRIRDEVRLAAELRGSQWPPDGVTVRGYFYRPPDPEQRRTLRTMRMRQLQNDARGYTTGDFTDSILTLVKEASQDGATPFLLVMPQSQWATAQLPKQPAESFDAALERIRAETGVAVLRALDLAPELRGRDFYWDHVNHLASDGARRLSRAVGQAVGQQLQAASPR